MSLNMLLNKRKFYGLGDENKRDTLNIPAAGLYQPCSEPAKTIRQFPACTGKGFCAFIEKSLAAFIIFRRQCACFPALVVFHNLAGCSGFVGLPLLIFTSVFIPPIFIGIHILLLVLVNLLLLTERSDRCRETLRSENDLSVIGIVRAAVVSSTPFYCVFSVSYISEVICSVGSSDSLLAIGGEV